MSQIEQLEAKRATVSRLVTTAQLSWCHKHMSAQISINTYPGHSHQHIQVTTTTTHTEHNYHHIQITNPSVLPQEQAQPISTHGDHLVHPPQAIKI